MSCEKPYPFLKNVGWMSFAMLAAGLLAFLYMLAAARILGVAQYGLFQASMGIFGLGTLLQIPMNMISLHCIGAAPEEDAATIAGELFFLAAVICLALFTAIVVCSPWIAGLLNAASPAPVLLVALLVVTTGLATTGYGILQGKRQYGRFSLIRISESLFVLILGILFMKAKWNVNGAILGYIAGKGIALAFIFTQKNFFKIKKSIAHIRGEFPSLINIIMALGLILVLDNLPMIAARIRLSSHESGLFAVLYNLRNVLWPFAFSVTVPFYAQMLVKDKQTEIFKKAVLLISLLGAGFIFAGVFFAQPILHLLYGKAYQEAAPHFAFYGVSLTLEMFCLILLFHQIALRSLWRWILAPPLAVFFIFLFASDLSIPRLILAQTSSCLCLLGFLFVQSRITPQKPAGQT